jgi:hypothetical protein
MKNDLLLGAALSAVRLLRGFRRGRASCCPLVTSASSRGENASFVPVRLLQVKLGKYYHLYR